MVNYIYTYTYKYSSFVIDSRRVSVIVVRIVYPIWKVNDILQFENFRKRENVNKIVFVVFQLQLYHCSNIIAFNFYCL